MSSSTATQAASSAGASAAISEEIANKLGNLEQLIRDAGYVPVDSFERGSILLNIGQALRLESNGVFYSWRGEYPKVVPPSSTPESTGGYGQTAWVDVNDLTLRSDLAQPTGEAGAALVKFNPFNEYLNGSVGQYLVTIPGADNTGQRNSVDEFNNAILKLAKKGGGRLKPEPGLYLIEGGSILLPSSIVLDLDGVRLIGDGNNWLIKSGAIVNRELIDITTEWGTLGEGAGLHFVAMAGVTGGELFNAAGGIRAHRFNYGSGIHGVTFDKTLKTGWHSTHSWGLQLISNTVYSPCIMADFVDWTTLEGNSFEGPGSGLDSTGLTIKANYGGSYSLRSSNNGFHHLKYGIVFECEADNFICQSCHFENVVNHLSGNRLRMRNFQIKNNWFKANLGSAASTVVPISFGALKDSEIGPNTFDTNGQSDFLMRVNLSSADCWGNRIYIPYSASGDMPDLKKYNISVTNEIILRAGSNISEISQPVYEPVAGSSGYTMEQYRHRYNYTPNKIPFCDVVYMGTTITIKTWLPWLNGGCRSKVVFDIFVFGSTKSVIIQGTFAWDLVNFDVNKDIYNGPYALNCSLSGSSDGYTVMTITGAPSGGAMNGWIKQL